MAARKNKYKTIQLLMSKGASINDLNNVRLLLMIKLLLLLLLSLLLPIINHVHCGHDDYHNDWLDYTDICNEMFVNEWNNISDGTNVQCYTSRNIEDFSKAIRTENKDVYPSNIQRDYPALLIGMGL